MRQATYPKTHPMFIFLISLALLLATSVSTPQSLQHSENLNNVAWRVINSLRRNDWKAFTRDAMPFIVLSQCQSLYESESRHYIANSIVGAFEKNLAHSIDFGSFDETMVALETQRDLPSEVSEGFTSFCKQVRFTWDEWKSPPPAGRATPRWSVGEYTEGVDGAEYLGPAVSGSIVSSEHWRIEFVRDVSGWRVSRLVSTTH
jgi:hypothetical protein